MKQLLLLTLLFVLFGCNGNTNQQVQKIVYTPVIQQYNAVWNEVISTPLTTLPQATVSYSKLFDGALDLISKNAKRTLENNADIIAPFDKLAHPNGVCLSGLWKIDKSNPYGGYFKEGSESLVIARASTAMSETKRGDTRAFGMAVKLFGTLDKNETLLHPTANIFVIDDLGGTDAQYYTDVALTNEPDVSFTSTVFGSFAYGLKVASAFSNADKKPGIRQLYEISYLGEANTSTVITPRWMKIEAAKNQTAFGVNDFRDEFSFDDKKQIIFNISVASEEVNDVKQWQKIGSITFDASVVSTTCDHRLHFHHPLWKDNLVYQ